MIASNLGHALALGFGCYLASVGAALVLVSLLRKGAQDAF